MESFYSDFRIFLSLFKGSLTEKLKNIIYFEACKNDTIVKIHGNVNEIIAVHSLKELETRVTGTLFMRIHKSYLINKYHILHVDKIKNEVCMTDGTILPISRRKRSLFISELKKK